MNYRALVRVSEECRARARQLYPPEGSVDGRPRYDYFVLGPLDAAKVELGQRFEGFPDEGDAVVTKGTSLFPPIVFYAVKVGDVIEIFDFEPDTDYLDVITSDPFD